MGVAEPHIRANMLAGLGDYVHSRHGLMLADLLGAVDLDPDQKPDPEQSLPLNAYARLLEITSERSGDPCFGLNFAAAFPRGGTRTLGYLILNAPDLRTCLECLCRYVCLQCDAIAFKFVAAGGVAHLEISCGSAFVAPRKQFLEFVCALVVGRLSAAFGNGWVPLKVTFAYREPSCGGAYEVLFGRNLVFDSAQTIITVRGDLLKARSETADDGLFALLRAIADKELVAIERSHSVIWQVSEYIVESLPLQAATLDRAAEALDRTPRQLQSDLKRLGTTFEKQVGRLRRSLTERYLRDSDLPLTEIALMLGFSELSAFTRAARSWFGMPPSQWRQKLRGRVA